MPYIAKYCRKCNEKRTGSYCSKCGTKLEELPKCKCGSYLNPADNYCATCGGERKQW